LEQKLIKTFLVVADGLLRKYCGNTCVLVSICFQRRTTLHAIGY